MTAPKFAFEGRMERGSLAALLDSTAASSPISFEIIDRLLFSAPATIGVISPPGIETATPTSASAPQISTRWISKPP